MSRKEYALELKYSTSKGRDTHGWNIVALVDNLEHKKRYSTCGGGYDMLGTVFAQWLKEKYFERIMQHVKPIDYDLEDQNRKEGVYGFFKKGEGRWLDGACGFDCMVNIARLIGLEVKRNWNERRKCTDYIFVTDTLAE